MPAPPGHVHVSEQQPGADLDCLWMAAIEWLRQTKRESIPATHAEGDALRAASGDVGFSNLGNLRLGVQRRYGWTLPASRSGFAAIWTALTPGTAALFTGRYTGWPAGSHWRRFYPTFIGGHATFGYRFDASDAVWWCDPGGPAVGYAGEPMGKADLERFIDAGDAGYGSLVLPIITEADMVPIVKPALPVTVDIAVGKQLYDLAGKALTKVSVAQVGAYSPFLISATRRAVGVATGNVYQLVGVAVADCTNVKPLTADCTAEVAAERTAANANLDAIVTFSQGKKR